MERTSTAGKTFTLNGSRIQTEKSRSSVSSAKPRSFGENLKESSMTVASLLKIARLVPSCMIENHLAQAGNFNLAPFAEEYDAAVLFADISGFSALAEQLTKQLDSTANAAEDLSEHIGKSLEKMVKTVCTYGGDVIKFAGDAILVVFKASIFDHSLEKANQCCIKVGLDLMKLDLRAGGVKLSVHCGAGAGKLIGYHVGGLHQRWEYVVTGSPIEQIGSAEPEAEAGQIVISPQAFELLGPGVLCKTLDSGNVLVEGFAEDNEVVLQEHPLIYNSLLSLSSNPEETKRMSIILRCYAPRPVLIYIDSGKGDWIAELRVCSTVFCRLIGLSFKSIIDLTIVQSALFLVQKKIYKYEGTLCRFIVDDKGAGILFAFGLPPFMHENDAVRATKASMEVHKHIQELSNEETTLDASLGVTTGRVFCGTAGGSIRCEYTLHGTLVNLAARFMVAAKSGVLCGESTFLEGKQDVLFNEPISLTVKGKIEPVKAYRPTKFRTTDVNLQEILMNLKPLPGRAQEEESIKSLFDDLANGLGTNGCLIIEGEAGTGKTSLAKFCHKAALETNKVFYMFSKAVDTEKTRPLFPLLSILSQMLVAHYIRAVGQYLWLNVDKPDQENYIGVQGNEFKFKVSFFQEVKRLGFPAFTALPQDLREEVLRDFVSEDTNTAPEHYEAIHNALPNFYGERTRESNEPQLTPRNTDQSNLTSLMFTIISAALDSFKKQRKQRRQSGFRSSIPSIIGLDTADGSCKEEDAQPIKEEESKNYSGEESKNPSERQAIPVTSPLLGNKLLRKHDVPTKSMFGFPGRRKKNSPSSYSEVDDNCDNKLSLAKSDSSNSEPVRLLFDSEGLGGHTELFVSGFLRLSQYSRVIICLEDIEYADIVSLQIILRLLQGSSQLMVILTTRTNAFTSKDTKKILEKMYKTFSLKKILLGNLIFEDLRQAISLWTSAKKTEENVVRIVFDRSQGHPLFSEELVKLMQSRGLLKIKDGTCVLVAITDTAKLDLPNNISSLIIAKLDRIKSCQLRLLKHVSVLGNVFTRTAAMELLGPGGGADNSLLDANIREDINGLIDLGLLVVHSSEMLAFQNSLLRESAYNLLLFKERKEMHMRVAESIFIKHQDYLDIFWDKLGFHYFAAEEYKTAYRQKKKSKAVKFLQLHGNECREVQNAGEVYNTFKKLIEIEDYTKDYATDGDEKIETNESVFQRAQWRNLAGFAARALGIEDEATKLFQDCLKLVGVEEPLPLSWLQRTYNSYKFGRPDYKFWKSVENLTLEKNAAFLVLAADALNHLGHLAEKQDKHLAKLRYESAFELAKASTNLIAQGEEGINNLSADETYNVLAQTYASSASFHIKSGALGYAKSIQHSELALSCLELTTKSGTKIDVLLKATEQAILIGNMEAADKLIVKVCWICKFTKSISKVYESYGAAVAVGMLRGKVAQAFYSATSANKISPTEENSKLLAYTAVHVAQYSIALREICNVCRVDRKQFRDVTALTRVVESNNDMWISYAFAAILLREHLEVSGALKVLTQGAQALALYLEVNEINFLVIPLATSMLFLFEEIAGKVTSKRKTLSRQSSVSFKVLPITKSLILPKKSSNTRAKAISGMSFMLKLFAKYASKYAIFEPAYAYSLALVAKQAKNTLMTVRYMLSEAAMIARSLSNHYMTGLAYFQLFHLCKGKIDDKESLIYKEGAEIGFQKSLKARVDQDILRIPSLQLHEAGKELLL